MVFLGLFTTADLIHTLLRFHCVYHTRQSTQYLHEEVKHDKLTNPAHHRIMNNVLSKNGFELQKTPPLSCLCAQ